MGLRRTISCILAAVCVVCGGCTGFIDADVDDQNNGGSDAQSQPDTSTNDPDGGDTDEEEEPGELTGNDLEQMPLFLCTDESQGYTTGRIRRVGRHEWTRNTGNPLGSVADRNPFDPRANHQYSTFSDQESLDKTTLEIYMGVLPAASGGWARSIDRQYHNGAIVNIRDDDVMDCMYTEDAPDDACVESYTEYLLEHGVLFRPPSQAEHDALTAFAMSALEAEQTNATGRPHTMQRIFSAAQMTTGALFRTEMGDGEPDEYGRHKLGDWEFAQAIAYALDGRATGSPGIRRPGNGDYGGLTAGVEGHLPMIKQAAIDGTISQPETIDAIVEAYVAGEDPYRKDLLTDVADQRKMSKRSKYWMGHGVRGFFREWLGYDEHEAIFKDTPHETSGLEEQFPPYWVDKAYGNVVSGSNGHEPTLTEQMDDMIARILFEDTDVFENLLTTRTYYTPATAYFEGGSTEKTTLYMNHVYNVTELTEDSREARWIEMPEDERAGVLTHPAFLASHAGNFENDPSLIHRGKWVRENMLCGSVPDLPITVEAALDSDTRDQSVRKRMTEQVDSREYCWTCHAKMNPLGYPFEIYNHAGFLRKEDHGNPPDGSATLVQMPDPALEGPVSDAVEMSEKFAESDYVKRCFIRQTFRYFMGREERQRDACTLAQMEQAYDDSGGSFAAMLAALFKSDSFQYRVRTPEETP
jgi:hypothetical protein